jgi:hypothetical protein
VFNISYDNQAAEVYDVFFEGAMDSIASGVLTVGQSSPFRAHVQCKSNGTGTTFWQADFDTYQMVQFAFTYTCVFPFMDMYYGSGPTVAKGGVVVAKDTEVVPAFGDFTFTIPASESVSLFSLYLDNIDKYSKLPHQFYALSFYADGTAMVPPAVFDPNYGRSDEQQTQQQGPMAALELSMGTFHAHSLVLLTLLLFLCSGACFCLL